MEETDSEFLRDFFADKARSKGKTKSGLATAMKLGRPSGVTDIIAPRAGVTPRKIQMREVPLIEAYIGEMLPSTKRAIEASRPKTEVSVGPVAEVGLAPVKGETAAGLWREFEKLDLAKFERVPVVPTSYGNREQFAYRVEGRSMEKEFIFDGDYVICVSFASVRAAPQTNDVVVVERRQGGRTERTCKKAVRMEGEIVLASQSDDPDFAEPIFLEGDDDTTVEVVGLVVGTYRPRL